jgi:HAE1 family hydrophobic/amphiphilic exporter-1
VRTFRLPSRIGVFGEARITLQQALAMALANNKDIEASRIDREISGYSLTGARGLYDPTIGAVSQFLKQINPVASSLGGSATGAVLNRIWQTDPTLSGSSPWLGGTYHVDFSSQKTYTNNTFVTLNPQYPSALVFQYTQPLLRNLRYDQTRHTIDVAQKNRSLSDQQFRLRVMQVVEQTERAYWEVFYAYNNLQVQLDSVDIARQQDESNRRQQGQGLLAPIDVVAAQTQLAQARSNYYTAIANYLNARSDLEVAAGR